MPDWLTTATTLPSLPAPADSGPASMRQRNAPEEASTAATAPEGVAAYRVSPTSSGEKP